MSHAGTSKRLKNYSYCRMPQSPAVFAALLAFGTNSSTGVNALTLYCTVLYCKVERKRETLHSWRRYSYYPYPGTGFVLFTACMITHIARVWINRIRLPILPVVSLTGKMNFFLSPFVPENLVPRDGFGNPVHVSLLISILRLNLVLTYGIPPEFRGGVHLFTEY